MRVATSPASALDAEPFADQDVANTVAQVSLQLHAIVGHGAARAAGFLELCRQLAQERRVVGESEDDSNGLAAAAGALHAQLRHGPHRYRFGSLGSAAAAAFRLPAAAADLPCGTRIDGPDVVA